MTIVATLYISPLPPLLSPQSTALHAYVALSSAPVKMVDGPPVFIDGPLFLKGFENILSYFKKNYKDLDSQLDSVQSAESTAYYAFVKLLAEPLTLHSHVIDSQNFPVTRSQICAQIPFPISHWTSHSLYHSVRTKLESFGLHESENNIGPIPLMRKVVDNTQVNSTIQQFTKELYSCLEWKLAKQEFLLGTASPTTIDAIIYAYISPHLISLPNNFLYTYLHGNHLVVETYLERLSNHIGKLESTSESSSYSQTFKSIILGDDLRFRKPDLAKMLSGWGIFVAGIAAFIGVVWSSSSSKLTRS